MLSFVVFDSAFKTELRIHVACKLIACALVSGRIGVEDEWTGPVTAVLENVVIILHRNLEHAADEIPSKLQRGLLSPFVREVLDGLSSLLHRVVQRVDFRFILRNNRLPSGSHFGREGKRFSW